MPCAFAANRYLDTPARPDLREHTGTTIFKPLNQTCTIELDKIKVPNRNVRRITDKLVQKMSRFMVKTRSVPWVVLDDSDMVLIGQEVVAAARALGIPYKPAQPQHILTVPFSTTRANKGAIIISPKNGDHDPLDLPPHQLRNMVRGIVWRDEHFDGMPIEDIAVREGLSKSGVRKIIMGSFDTLMSLQD